MRLALTQHARDVMEEREIPPDWVKKVLTSPERIEADADDPDLEHRMAHISEHGGRVLRVVLNAKSRPLRVVTVYFDRTMRRKL